MFAASKSYFSSQLWALQVSRRCSLFPIPFFNIAIPLQEWMEIVNTHCWLKNGIAAELHWSVLHWGTLRDEKNAFLYAGMKLHLWLIESPPHNITSRERFRHREARHNVENKRICYPGIAWFMVNYVLLWSQDEKMNYDLSIALYTTMPLASCRSTFWPPNLFCCFFDFMDLLLAAASAADSFFLPTARLLCWAVGIAPASSGWLYPSVDDGLPEKRDWPLRRGESKVQQSKND